MPDIVPKNDDLLDTDEIIEMVTTLVMVVMVAWIVASGVAQALTSRAAAAVQGITDYYNLNVTSTPQEITFANPLAALTVENLGTVVMYIKTNSLNSTAIPIGQGEAVPIDAGGTIIQRLFYYTQSGVTQGRAIGLY